MSKGGRRGVPPDLKGTLGTLLRTTINQVGAVTDVARRSAATQKQRLDGALLERRRREVLADLGVQLVQLVQSGEIELGDLPELTRHVEEVADLDRRIAEAEAQAAAGAVRRPVRLTRRPGKMAARPEREELRVWRPPGIDRPGEAPASAPAASDAGAGIAEGAASAHAAAPGAPARGAGEPSGGIVFLDDEGGPDPDEDLAEYMNDDDVPGRRG
ncbi:MAG TPA: hypothetical protein VKZ63_07945 [Kofleriaceae bacterium]|nr:hypothetical protein [Kofleriaceae bacterium]